MRKTRTKAVVSLAGTLALAGGLYWLSRAELLPSCEELHELMHQWGSWAWIGYLAGATVASLVFVPRTLTVVVAGIAFPLVEANVLVTLSSLASACLAFYVARYTARGTVERLMARHGWFEKLSLFVHANELAFVTITRLVHVLPYAGVNYALGVFPIAFRHYFVGTLIGLIPGTIGLVYAGHTVGCLLVDGEGDLPPAVRMKLLVGGALLSLLAAIPAWWSYRRGKRHAPAKKAIRGPGDGRRG